MTAFQSLKQRQRAGSRELRLSRIFLLIAPLLYAAFALLTPPFQTPDEHQHLFRAWQLSDLHLVGERQDGNAGGVLPDSLGTAASRQLGSIEPHAPRPVVARPFDASLRNATPLNTGAPPRFYNFLGSVAYSPAGYIPQVIAIWFGKATALSIENIVRLGRLLNAALAILLIYAAIRVTPVGSLAIAWVGLSPMTVASSAAFGQDGLVIGGACLLTGVGLRVLFGDSWRRSELLIAGSLTILMTLSKLVYLPLMLIGGLPFVKGGIQPRRLLVPSIVCLMAAAVTAVWVHAVSGLVLPAHADIPPAGGRIAAWMSHPSELVVLLERTFIGHGMQLFDTFFAFGWLNVGPVRSAAFLSMAALALVVLAGDAAAHRLEWRTRLWLLVLAAGTALLIAVAVHLYWSPASATSIQGLQGRYFIPVAPLVLVACLAKRKSDAPYDAIVMLLMVAANLLAITAIVTAFYLPL